MSRTDNSEPRIADTELVQALEPMLGRYFGTPRRIVRLERRPSSYRSSFTLEELELELDDGMTLPMVFKDLSWQALLPEARRIKPAFLHDPLREIETYRKVLAEHRLGSAICYGAVVNPALGRYWLVLEKVPGLELYQVGDFAIWQHVAVWLAQMQKRFTSKSIRESIAPAAHLLIYNRDYYWLWMKRAQDFLGAVASTPKQKDTKGLNWLISRYDQVIDRLLAMPETFVHGEFYASNILVNQTGNTARICPVDWEMAAVGPILIDLAALTAGNWTEKEKTALAFAYHSALNADGAKAGGTKEFLEALDCCRLHLAVRWLGWSPRWSPPPEHAQDWLREALCLAEKLG
jgi:hypothetical protein